MKTIKTLTLILFPLFSGLFIGSAINNDAPTCIGSLILLSIDIIVGIIAEHFSKYSDDDENDEDTENDQKIPTIKKIGIVLFVLQAVGLISALIQGDSIFGSGFANLLGRFSFTIVGIILFFVADRRQKNTTEAETAPTPPPRTNTAKTHNNATQTDEPTHTTKIPIDTLCNFHRQSAHKLIQHGTKLLDKPLFFYIEGAVLINVCMQMEFKPHIRFTDIYSVDAEMLNGLPAIIYGCHFDPNTIAENAIIILIATEENAFRLFTVETHQRRFFLCEYPGYGHILHDEVLPEEIPEKIEELLQKS